MDRNGLFTDLSDVSVSVDVEAGEDLDRSVHRQLLVQALVQVQGAKHLHTQENYYAEGGFIY